ncbi:acVLRF1 family peptidyl-tRNA hydrolase [Catellatospora sichuanensis]|uniref:acVLRF1 family peptidyl-tRNA hydrolase n=1 Tax=Catellatospora sichuanensis TaxID=1969805 RepID=UPI001FECC923|nr:acVLRF1 family peptidyl-tRNA hydrolase [Catellatospora sichuanensis]
MMPAKPAAGGGRWADVEPRRLRRWLDGFYSRHDGAEEEGLKLVAANGDTAELLPPPGLGPVADVDALLAALAVPRRLGLLLARRNAVAVGVADGDELISSKVDTFYVQGRTAAGGWSQQRYARRRENQASGAARDAADIAARILLPYADSMAALVCGGDRGTVDEILTDRRLAPLLPLRHDRLLDVPEPRHAILVDAITAAHTIRIHLVP